MTPEHVFFLLGVAVIVYALTGGADFGGGVWDLLASGPRRRAQRRAIAHAIAPIWEVNHIWMIFAVVLLFTCFPHAFAAVSVALHIPLVLALICIVLRGAAFVFRSYGLQPSQARARWGRVFAWSSALTPVFLGMCLAALSSGQIRIEGQLVVSGFLAGWTSSFAVCVGLFALSLFTLLAAVYMAVETQGELRDDFRRRALINELVSGALAGLVLWRAWAEAPLLFGNLLGAPWSLPAQALTAVAAAAVIATLLIGKVELARLAVMAQVGFVVLGWGLAMNGHLILPDMPLARAGAQPRVLASLPWVLLGGAALFVPALTWLYRVFKLQREPPADR